MHLAGIHRHHRFTIITSAVNRGHRDGIEFHIAAGQIGHLYRQLGEIPTAVEGERPLGCVLEL